VANINIVVLVLNSQLVHPLADIKLRNTVDVLFSEFGTSSSVDRQLFFYLLIFVITKFVASYLYQRNMYSKMPRSLFVVKYNILLY
jgi:hypothetical protein